MDCAQSIYTIEDIGKKNLLDKGENGLDFATEYWYTQGEKNFDYSTGKVKTGGDKLAVD